MELLKLTASKLSNDFTSTKRFSSRSMACRRILTACEDQQVKSETNKNKVITTMAIMPLDDRCSCCERCAFTHLGIQSQPMCCLDIFVDLQSFGCNLKGLVSTPHLETGRTNQICLDLAKTLQGRHKTTTESLTASQYNAQHYILEESETTVAQPKLTSFTE